MIEYGQPSRLDLSIVIPSYNSAPWLPQTLDHLLVALDLSALKAEIIVVDDGSTDDTADVVAGLAHGGVVLRTVRQENRGVFEAVRRGAVEAHAARVLILNSRLLIDPDALAYLEGVLPGEAEPETRNGHVRTASDVPIVGRFWEVLTHIFWGSYLRDPKMTLLTPDVFDRVPKGTGFLVVGRERLLRAYAAMSADAGRFVSDDTRLLRLISGERPIILDPNFRATYRPRVTVRGFLRHAFLRGTLFVDSYYGTTPARTLALWALAVGIPAAAAILACAVPLGLPWLAGGVLLVALAGLVAVLATAARNRAPGAALAGFTVYIVPFAVVFWAGLARGFWVRFAVRNGPRTGSALAG